MSITVGNEKIQGENTGKKSPIEKELSEDYQLGYSLVCRW